jgi:hypothetical protein
MKHIRVALALCALPATAFAQDVVCHACDHVAPYFRGVGGFIGTVADGVDEVTFVASCGSVTTTGQARIHGDTASQLFNRGNGAACDQEGGTLEIAGLEDGGWYWITDDTNSAVGNLVAKDVLENETTDITSAGDGVTMTVVKGAVYLKEVATGRVGILPNILPEMTMEPAAVNNCSFTTSGTTHTRETTACMLGDGRTSLLVQGPTNIFTGKRDPLGANAMVTRPVSGSVTVVADLWGNGSGHFTTDAAGDARLGHPGGTRLPAMISAVLVGDGAAADTPIESSEVGGMTLDAATTTSLGELTIGADSAYCGTTANHTATVKFTATIASDMDRDVVTPSIVAGDRGAAAGVAATHTIMVVCPSASADMGQELVPENPFPVE